jgi:hypothetical protein
MTAGPQYVALARTAQKTPLPIVAVLFRVTQPLPKNVFSLAPQFWLPADMPQYIWCLLYYISHNQTIPPLIYLYAETSLVQTTYLWNGR